MGGLSHLLSFLKRKGNKKISLCREGIGIKIVIHKELCMTKYITYIHFFSFQDVPYAIILWYISEIIYLL